ncbi:MULTISPECIES: outer membrane beta-barrel family protein [unclassified Sphingobacterium]|uniref:outer membrane beta-barrel family protein n=1 Tax=unclassified Sphingobacterium TaxID=2609468 RepID=UPI0025ECF1B0|nr:MULTISPECIES: outer membrane beta-barrel family protein [unclassified Sphingobacterium]
MKATEKDYFLISDLNRSMTSMILTSFRLIGKLLTERVIIVIFLGSFSQNLIAKESNITSSSSMVFTSMYVQDTAKVNGVLVNQAGTPVVSATVSLFSNNGSLLSVTSTDTSGVYRFNHIAEQNMSVTFRHINFEDQKIIFNRDILKNLPLVTFLKDRNSVSINEVEVIGRRKSGIVKTTEGFSFRIDEAMSHLTIWEVMKQAPLIDARDDGTLNVLGKSGVQVYINGRKTNLGGNDLLEMLKNMSSENLRDIEIITSPSSKYEAQGNAGIINIILKKQQNEGIQGSANLSSEFAHYSTFRGNVNLNHAKGKVASQLNLRGAGTHNRLTESFDYIFPTIDLWNKSFLDRNEESNPFGATMLNDISLTEKNTLLIQTNASYSSNELDWLTTNNFRSIETNVEQSHIRTQTLQKTSNSFFNVDVNDRLELDTMGSQLSIGGSFFTQESHAKAPYTVLDDNEEYFFQTSSKQRVRNFSGQVALHKYLNPSLSLDVGIMSNFNRNTSNNQFSDLLDGKLVNDPSKENDYSYKEHIYALYSSVNWKISEKLNSTMGFRLEKTDIDGFEKNSSQELDINYLNFFPNVSLTYSLNNVDKLGLTVGSRISRPGFWELNPTPVFSAPMLYYKGNAFLIPARSVNAELSYILKQKLTFLANYSRVSDDWMQFQVTRPGSDTVMYDRFNYGHNDIAGLSVNYYDSYFEGRLKINTNLGLNYNIFRGNIPIRNVNEETWMKQLRIRTDYNIDKKGDKSLYLSYFYFSPFASAQGLLKSRQAFEIGGMMKIKNFTVQVSGRDLFNQSMFRTEVANGSVSRSSGTIDAAARRFVVTFGYSFGNMKTKKAESVGGAASEQKGRVPN